MRDQGVREGQDRWLGIINLFTFNHPEESKILKHLLAGGLAGAVSRTCVSPLERVKILFQVPRDSSDASVQRCVHAHRAVGATRLGGCTSLIACMSRRYSFNDPAKSSTEVCGTL